MMERVPDKQSERTCSALDSWAALNTALQTATEKEAEAILNLERNTENRLAFLIRAYGRYNKLRTIRERNALARSAK